MKKVLLILATALLIFSCKNETMNENETSAIAPLSAPAEVNPFIGTWKAEGGDPNWWDLTHAMSTITFTETEFTNTYEWLSSGKKEEHKGTYTYNENFIFLTVTEKNGEPIVPYPSQHAYRFFEGNLHIDRGPEGNGVRYEDPRIKEQ